MKVYSLQFVFLLCLFTSQHEIKYRIVHCDKKIKINNNHRKKKSVIHEVGDKPHYLVINTKDGKGKIDICNYRIYSDMNYSKNYVYFSDNHHIDKHCDE